MRHCKVIDRKHMNECELFVANSCRPCNLVPTIKDKQTSLYDHPTCVIKSTLDCIRALRNQVQFWLTQNWIESYEYLNQEELKTKHEQWDASQKPFRFKASQYVTPKSERNRSE